MDLLKKLESVAIRWVACVGVAGFGVGLASASPTHAASFSASAFGLLVIDDIATSGETLEDLDILGSAVNDSGALGGATADGSASFLGDGLDQEALVSGTATPSVIASAFYFTDGDLTLENNSVSETFTVSFTFDYALTASANAGNLEDAFAVAAVQLSTLTSLVVYEVLVADTLFGEPGGFISDGLSFEVSVGPGETQDLFLLVDAEGTAVSAVPAPAALPLAATALAVLGAVGARRRKA